MDAFAQGAISGRTPSKKYIDDLIQSELDYAATNAYRNQALADQRRRDEQAQKNFETTQTNAIDTADANRRASTMSGITNLAGTALLSYAMKPSTPGGVTGVGTTAEPGVISSTLSKAGNKIMDVVNPYNYSNPTNGVVTNTLNGSPQVYNDLTYIPAGEPAVVTPSAPTQGVVSDYGVSDGSTLMAPNTPPADITIAGDTIQAATPVNSGVTIANEGVTGLSEAASSQSTFSPAMNAIDIADAEAGAGMAGSGTAGTTGGPTIGGAAGVVAYIAAADMVRNQWGQLDKVYGERSPWAKFTSAPVTGGVPALLETIGMGDSNYFAKGPNRLARAEEKWVGEPLDKAFQGDILGSLQSFGGALLDAPRDAWNLSVGAISGGLLDTWLCTQVNRFIGLTDLDNKDLQTLRRFSIKNHRPWIRFYLDFGKFLVAAIKSAIPDKARRREFYSALKVNMVLPVLRLIRENRMEEAYILYKEYTTDLFKKYAPEFVSSVPTAD